MVRKNCTEMRYKVGDKVKFYDGIFAMQPITGQVVKVNKATGTSDVALHIETVDEDNLVEG